MKIFIEDLKFQAIIGILDFERTTPQEVNINLSIEYDYKDDFINYAEVTELLKSTMKNEKYFLIEEALNDLSNQLKKNFPKIQILHLKISKPSILPDCNVAVEEFYRFNS
jgi:dihydroneopterin aldolase